MASLQSSVFDFFSATTDPIFVAIAETYVQQQQYASVHAACIRKKQNAD